MKAPFTLQLEFKHIAGAKSGKFDEDDCAVLDIRLIVEPMLTAQDALKCSAKELQDADESRKQNW
jgi:hypothetical protein